MSDEPTVVKPFPDVLPIPLAIALPVIHIDRFAELVGVSSGVVGGWIDRGYLPTYKLGRYTLINLAQLTQEIKDGVVS